MRRLALATSILLLSSGLAQAQTVAACASVAAPQPLPVQPTVVAPLAPELAAPRHQLGAPSGVLSHAFDESLSVEQVLFRIQVEQCQTLALSTPAAVPGALPASAEAAAYKPQTEFDNTPWRFDMNQNGKRMTADEFSAWMKAKGVRVARGAAVVAPAAVAPVAAAAGATSGPQGVAEGIADPAAAGGDDAGATPAASGETPATAPETKAESAAEGDSDGEGKGSPR